MQAVTLHMILLLVSFYVYISYFYYFPLSQNAVYVYDGIPKFISANESGKSRELGAFCGKDEKQSMTVYATSGVFTIFFEGDLSGEITANLPFLLKQFTLHIIL